MEKTPSSSESMDPVRPVGRARDDVYTLTLTRSKQLAGVAVHLFVQIDQMDTYEMSLGARISLPVRAAKHHLAFWYGGPAVNARWKARFDIEVSRDMELLIKYSSGVLTNAIALYEGNRVVGKSKFGFS